MAKHNDLNQVVPAETPAVTSGDAVNEELRSAEPAPIPQPETPAQDQAPEVSYFYGTTLQLIGWRLLGLLLSVLTLGIGTPWAQCMVYRWQINHTTVGGKDLHFDGKGHQLLGKYLLWGLLTVITLGIYAIWIPVRMHKWKAQYTRFAAPGETQKSLSGLAILGAILGSIAVAVLLFLGIRPLIAELPQKLPHFAVSAENFFDQFFDDHKSPFEPSKPTEDPFSEGTFFMGDGNSVYIIDNGDGTYTVIYGDPTGVTDTTDGESGSQSPSTGSGQTGYSFTDDPRIIGGWLFRAILRGGTELEAGELRLAADGTFTYYKDLFSDGGVEWGWRPDGIGESRSRGAYTFYDGVLTLYYGEYFYEMYSSEPGEWVATDATVTQQITFAETGDAIYFSSISDVFTHNGYFDPIEYCPRITGSVSDMLDAIYPDGIQ